MQPMAISVAESHAVTVSVLLQVVHHHQLGIRGYNEMTVNVDNVNPYYGT